MTKEDRQKRILKLIEQKNIKTQIDLVENLLAEGINVTQSTISRDLRELGLIKSSTDGFKRYYTATEIRPGQPEDPELEINYQNRIKTVFKESVVSIQKAYFLIVIHTLPGMAQAAAHMIDVLKLEEIVGTIAGDDTIFVAVKEEKHVDQLLDLFEDLMN